MSIRLPQKFLPCLVVGLGLLLPSLTFADYRDHSAAQAFAARMAGQHGFAAAEVLDLLGKAERRDDILALMRRPAEGKPWHG